ncbi:MAG: hypothetical protein ABFR53_08710 [Actinomycetota bacterium]
MLVRRILVLVIALGLVAAACGGSISASDCDELSDVMIQHYQRLIDDVDEEFGNTSVEAFLATDGDLPSIERFEKDAAKIDELASELGCSGSEMRSTVQQRVGELRAQSDLGRFIIQAIRTGSI